MVDVFVAHDKLFNAWLNQEIMEKFEDKNSEIPLYVELSYEYLHEENEENEELDPNQLGEELGLDPNDPNF